MPLFTAPLPLSRADLERFRLRAHKRQRQNLMGGHQMRRKGQSLEFHDYRVYVPGDDVRHVDWRASARFGMSRDLLVREFTAEERLTIIISLDFRESMWLPEDLPKVTIASWLAEAISAIAAQTGDEVWLHRLFGKGASALVPLRGGMGARNVLARWWRQGADGVTPDLDRLSRTRPPAAVWLVLSDFYFESDETTSVLTRAIRQAQQDLCWTISLDLDSWPHERELLGLGSRYIEGPDARSDDRRLVEIEPPGLQNIEDRILAHKSAFRERLGKAGHDAVHWHWPAETSIDSGAFFRRRFREDTIIQRLFMREAG